MAIGTSNAYSGPYLGNGSTTAFPFTFSVLTGDQVSVQVDGADVPSSEYSVSLSGPAPSIGTVTFGTAPASGATIFAYLDPEFSQDIEFADGAAWLAKPVNDGYDQSALRDQALKRDVRRSLLLPIGDSGQTLPSADNRKGKYLAFDAAGNPITSSGTGNDPDFRADAAEPTGATLVGANDGANGSIFTNVQGFINASLPVATRTALAAVPASTGRVIFLYEAGREGWFKCFPGSPPVADLWQGIYVVSNTAGYYWARIWDQRIARPEWFGVTANDNTAAAANDTKIAACYAAVPHTQFGPFDYWTSATIKANINHHKISGFGEKYNDQFGAMTRIVCTSDSTTIMQVGPDVFPGSINALPQGIEVRDIYLARSVAPSIASGCRGLLTRWVLNATIENVKTDGNMIGFEEYGTVYTFKKNCEAVRASAGTGGGTDYFVGHYANGGGGLAAGGNASLYNVDCSAGCNYGPLQTATGSIGFKADQGFTDVWYWNPETVNFYIGQAVYGNDNTGLVFSNTDFAIFHPIHDQFKYTGIYVTDVATSGSVEIENPYYGPSSSARACYWVNSSEGAVVTRGGQFVMGGAPSTQAITLQASRGCDVLDYPVILEHGNTYPACGLVDVSDARIEVFGKNPTVSAGALVQLSGTCANIQVHAKSSGKASAFQYGVQIVGTGVSRSTFDVSGFNSSNFPAPNLQLDNNGTPITAAGAFATNCLGQGNFN